MSFTLDFQSTRSCLFFTVHYCCWLACCNSPRNFYYLLLEQEPRPKLGVAGFVLLAVGVCLWMGFSVRATASRDSVRIYFYGLGSLCVDWCSQQRCKVGEKKISALAVLVVLSAVDSTLSVRCEYVKARYLVDPASSHMLVSKIKPCMSKYKPVMVKPRMAH